MPEISPASSLLDVASPMKVESKRERNGSDLINEHFVSITASSEAGVWHLKRYCTNVTNNALTWLRQWRPTNKAKRATADNQFSVVGHSLLQQAEDVSIQLQERLAPPPPPSLRLKGKTGWFLGAGILAGATAGTLSLRYYSTPNATAANDFPADVPEPLALRGGATAIENMGYFEHIPPALQSANLIRESYPDQGEDHHLVYNTQHKKKSGIHRFLRKANLLDRNVAKDALKKEALVSAVAKYIYSHEIDGPKAQTARAIRVAMHILAEMDLYGGRKGEVISHDFAQSVISHWVFRQILGTSPGQFVADVIKKSEYPSYFTLSSLKHILNFNTLFSTGLLKYHDIPENQWSVFNTLWHFYLEKEIPIMKWREQGIDSISLGSQRFADLCVGTAFLNDGNYLKDFSLNETLQTGNALWNIAMDEGVDIDNAGYFLLPSLLVLASNRMETSDTENNVFGSNVTAVSTYVAYRKKFLEAEQALTRMFERYQSATHVWLSKGKLADKIIADCPATELIATPDRADGARTRQQMREKKARSAKQAYMNNIMKPCRRAPENLDEEYKKLTHEVADAFEEIDKVFIWSALVAANKKEVDFFSSPNATINSVHFSMRASRPVGSVHSVSVVNDFEVKTKNTDLFSATVNNEERIYALKKKMNNPDSGYQLLRVDRNISDYINNGILDYDFFSKEYIVQGNKVLDKDTFTFSISTLNDPIKYASEEYNPVAEHFSQVHREAFYHSLYETGNDKSDLQKIWSVVKHLIPFYDCVEGIANRDAVQAVPACMLDIIALIPVAGQAASMGSRFGMGLAKGLKLSGKTLMRGSVADAGNTMLRQIRLPTINEVLTLGKNTLSAVDPGFALLSRGNKVLLNTLESYLSRRANSSPLAKKISTYHTVEKSALAPKDYITARMPHSDIDVPVEKIGGDAQNAIYALVNPDNGEIFGRHYTLSDNGRLILDKKIMQQLQSRPNVVGNSEAMMRMAQTVFPVQAGAEPMDIDVELGDINVEPMEIDIEPGNINAKTIDVDIKQRDTVAEPMDWSPSPPDVSYIPLLDAFLPLPRHPQPQPDEVLSPEQYLEKAKVLAQQDYKKNVFICSFDEDIASISEDYQLLKQNLPNYKEKVLLATRHVNNLSRKLSLASERDHYGRLIHHEIEGEISVYLSKVLGLDEVDDENIVRIIKEGAMERLVYFTENIKKYLNNETKNIHFITSGKLKETSEGNSNRLMGFMYPFDSDRRIFLMVDNIHVVKPLSTRLDITVLHEASHVFGTLDFQVAPSTSLVGDASEYMEAFNDGIYEENNERIFIHEFFIETYLNKIRELKKLDKYEDIDVRAIHIIEMFKKDPILKANAFMDNADFVARVIADLATRTPANVDSLYRRKRKAEPFHVDMTVVLCRLALGMMKKNTLIDRV